MKFITTGFILVLVVIVLSCGVGLEHVSLEEIQECRFLAKHFLVCLKKFGFVGKIRHKRYVYILSAFDGFLSEDNCSCLSYNLLSSIVHK